MAIQKHTPGDDSTQYLPSSREAEELIVMDHLRPGVPFVQQVEAGLRASTGPIIFFWTETEYRPGPREQEYITHLRSHTQLIDPEIYNLQRYIATGDYHKGRYSEALKDLLSYLRSLQQYVNLNPMTSAPTDIDLNGRHAGVQALNAIQLPLAARSVPTLEREFARLRRAHKPASTYIIVTPSTNRPDDISFLESDLAELKAYQKEQAGTLEPAFLRALQGHIDARQTDLARCQAALAQQEQDRTEYIRVEDVPPVDSVEPDRGVRRLFKRIFGSHKNG